MGTLSLALPAPHKGGQRAIYQALQLRPDWRFFTIACGRRFGKTTFGKTVTAEAVLRHNMEVWFISPTYKMSSAIWREFRTSLGNYAGWVSAQDRAMEFAGGGSLTVWSGESADTMRGGAPDIVIVDEAAMIRNPDMWPAVIRPALTDKQGRALFLSTPRGHNWFWELFNRGYDPLFPEYKSFRFPTINNPTLPNREAEVGEARRSLPDRLFRQEYLAEFMEDAGGVFRGVAEISTLQQGPPLRENDSTRYVFGVDWGRSNDFTVISVFDRHLMRQVAVDRFTDIGWAVQRMRLRKMYDLWQPSVIWAESNSIGEVNIEALQADGLPMIPFWTTNQTKTQIIESLAGAIERKEILLLNDRVQVAELQAYEFERSPSGVFRYNAPDGAHDDMVIALALSYYGALMSATQWEAELV